MKRGETGGSEGGRREEGSLVRDTGRVGRTKAALLLCVPHPVHVTLCEHPLLHTTLLPTTLPSAHLFSCIFSPILFVMR